MEETVLKIENLCVDFKNDQESVRAVNHLTIELKKGKVLGLVGESGSGKSVTALSVMKLLSSPPATLSGKILYQGKDLVQASESEMRKIRGKEISMIFQEPMTSLNPVFKIGDQIAETLLLHQNLNVEEAKKKTLDLMEKVGIPRAKERMDAYPHELSGGQKQRVMIAMAIACEPKILIADEPTTALDVTIQKQVLDLLLNLQKSIGMSVLFITHDLGVIGDIADDVAVMYRGNVVENTNSKKLFTVPEHPYSKGLLSCRPSMNLHLGRLVTVSDLMTEKGEEKSFSLESHPEMTKKRIKKESSDVLLELQDLRKSFPLKKNFFGKPTGWIHAVHGVNLKVNRGSTLGLVGESGCGKSTLGRMILRLLEPTFGKIIYDGKEITSLSTKEMIPLRTKMQIVFQDPYSSLNPRLTILDTLLEPMQVHRIGADKKERVARAEELMRKVGLKSEQLSRYPHEFSGGQRQRICIARALSVEPEFIVCDESVSALDVSVQAQILNLLLDLQEELGLTYIFISHDLSVVRFMADHLAVMNQGKIVEYGSAQEIYNNPKEKYTQTLLHAIPQGLPKEVQASEIYRLR